MKPKVDFPYRLRMGLQRIGKHQRQMLEPAPILPRLSSPRDLSLLWTSSGEVYNLDETSLLMPTIRLH